MVYDAPLTKGNFSKRLKLMDKRMSELNSKYVIVHKH